MPAGGMAGIAWRFASCSRHVGPSAHCLQCGGIAKDAGVVKADKECVMGQPQMSARTCLGKPKTDTATGFENWAEHWHKGMGVD